MTQIFNNFYLILYIRRWIQIIEYKNRIRKVERIWNLKMREYYQLLDESSPIQLIPNSPDSMIPATLTDKSVGIIYLHSSPYMYVFVYINE